MSNSKSVVAIKAPALKPKQSKTPHYDDFEPLDVCGFPHLKQKSNNEMTPKPTLQNLEYLCRELGISIRADVMSKEIKINMPGLQTQSVNNLNSCITIIESIAILNGMSPNSVAKYVSLIADKNPVNPVADWITSDPWDKEDHCGELCDTLTFRDEFPEEFGHTLIRKWLLSAVAAATEPSGFHSRGIVVFQGAQGIGKTSWIRNLMPSSLLRDQSILTGHHLDPSNKDSLTTAIKHWIVELGELDSSFKKDISRLKGFITQDKDSIRRPYARTNSEYQRRTIFAASVNEENFLIDTTGNSRFWTLPVVEMQFDHPVNMQQVFSQLYVQLQNKASWWLSNEEDKLLESLNSKHKAVSIVEESVMSIMDFELPEDKWRKFSAKETLQLSGLNYPTNQQARECGSVLRPLYGQPKKIQGTMKWTIPVKSKLNHFN